MVTKLTIPRCYFCRMHLNLCFCEDLILQVLATQIIILTHYGERHCITNTGHLIPKCLLAAEIRYRGNPDRSPAKLQDLVDRPNTFVLYPSSGAQILDATFKNKLSGPATLIALDGNWGQASHMIHKEPVLQKLPKVVLPAGKKSEYHLRRNQLEGNVCTFEAIARALGQLESQDVQDRLEQIFNKMITRSLWMRGKISKTDVHW